MEVRLLFSKEINDTAYILEEFDTRKVSLDVAMAEVDVRPLLAVARQWAKESRMRDLAARMLETRQHLIVLPQWPRDLDVAGWLGYPLPCTVQPARGSDVAGGSKISYRCVFTTACNDSILHFNEAGQPLTIRYQSFSGSGGITVTTLDLNFWLINTSDKDQQRVWKELITWRPDIPDIKTLKVEQPEDSVVWEHLPLEMLLALAVRDEWEPEKLAKWSGKILLARFSPEDWRSFINIAMNQGLVHVVGNVIKLNLIVREALENYLVTQGHFGVLRELRRGNKYV